MIIKVIVLAGGDGRRFGMMKQFIPINNIPIFIYTIKKFKDYSIVLTTPEKFIKITKNILIQNNITNVKVIAGGKTRQESVFNALKEIAKEPCDKVIITDANRPLITKKTIKECINNLKRNQAIITVCKSINTTCISEDYNFLSQVLPRTHMYDMLMPQCFDFNLIYQAHKNTKIKNATDDTQLLKNIKIKILPISFWEGLKLTYVEDYKVFEILLKDLE